MNPTDLMKDPHYARIMHQIESLIHERDVQARETESVSLTDSNVKSSLRKAMGMLQGKPAPEKPGDARELWIGRIAIELTGLAEYMMNASSISTREFLNALLAVEDSLKTRRALYGHSRGYLDFLKGFIEDGTLN